MQTDGASTGMTVGVHDGTFHADEAMAVAMLRFGTAEFAGCAVVRSRQAAVLAPLPVVCDVGGVYDATNRRFDHHQRGFAEVFDAARAEAVFNTKLSSAGLVYKHYGRTVLGAFFGDAAAPADVEFAFVEVYRRLIAFLDAVDNGCLETSHDDATSLPARVKRLNHADGDKLALFNTAVDLCWADFQAVAHDVVLHALPARQLVQAAFARRASFEPSARVIVFPDSHRVFCCGGVVHGPLAHSRVFSFFLALSFSFSLFTALYLSPQPARGLVTCTSSSARRASPTPPRSSASASFVRTLVCALEL